MEGLNTESINGASSAIVNILQPVEFVLGTLKLNTPFKRQAAFTAIGTAVEFYFKPSWAYNSDGSMKAIAYLTDKPGATYTPAGFFPLLFGLVTALYL